MCVQVCALRPTSGFLNRVCYVVIDLRLSEVGLSA
jgi:hypothetical protein